MRLGVQLVTDGNGNGRCTYEGLEMEEWNEVGMKDGMRDISEKVEGYERWKM
jgi:hypothetical protein